MSFGDNWFKASDMSEIQRIGFLATGLLCAAVMLGSPQRSQAAEDVAYAPPAAKAKAKSKTKAKTSPKSSAATANDWPQYLGPNRNNISNEKGLLRTWPKTGPKLLKTASGLGAGYSSVSIANGMIYTMGTRGDKQSILAMDLETLDGRWELVNGPSFQEGAGNGPRASPTIDGGQIYALGAHGDLTCADAVTGKRVWEKNILKEFNGNNVTWGVCESVLIDGDKLICTPGGRDGTMVALDKTSGDLIWKCQSPENDQEGYASAIAIDVDGVRQYVQFTNRGTIGVRASDGKFMWRNDSAANGTANCSSPMFFDNMIFSASGYGTGGAMVKLMSSGGETSAEFGYHTKEMKSHHGGFVIVDGYIYGSNEGVFVCMELTTGKVLWQNRNPGKGSLTCVDGMIIARNEGGPVTLIEVNPKAYKELGRFDQPDRSNNAAWSYPVVSHGRLYLRDQDKLMAFEVGKKK